MRIKSVSFINPCKSVILTIFNNVETRGRTIKPEFQLNVNHRGWTRLFALVISVFVGSQCFAQDSTNDQWYSHLQKQLSEATSDTSKVEAWVELSSYFKFSRADSGVYYGTKALELARAISYTRGEVKALHYLGLSYLTLGNESTGLKVNLECLRISRQSDYKDFEGYSMIVLGAIYYDTKNFEMSKAYYERSFSLFKSIGQSEFEAISQGWLGRNYLAIGQPDSALLHCHQALNLAKSTRIGWAEGLAGFLLAMVYRDLNATDSSLFYFKVYENQFLGEYQYSQMNLEMAKLYQLQGKKDSSVYRAYRALEAGIQNNLFSEVTNASAYLSTILEPVEGMQYAQLAIAYTDSLNELRRNASFSDVTDFDEQLRQHQLANAESAYQSRLRTNVFLGSTFTLLIIAFFLYRNSRNRQKAKLKIEQAYAELKSTQSQLIQSEKMASLGELTAGIAHEIQNPLNFVNNFSEVSAELVKEMVDEVDKGNTDVVKAIANDVVQNLEKINHHGKRAADIVKGMLQHSRTSSGVREPTDINALCDEYLRLSYHGLRAKDKAFNAKFETDFDSTLPKLNVVPQEIGRVVLNLINNAFYATSEKLKVESKKSGSVYEPLVTVSTKATGDKIQISVKDNGNGIPDSIREKIFQPFFTTKPTGQGTGLGLSLSYDIVKAHGGTIDVESRPMEGTEFKIMIPGA